METHPSSILTYVIGAFPESAKKFDSEVEASMENVGQIQLAEAREIWKRGLFMLLFAIAFNIGQTILALTAVLQFVWLLAKRERNEYLAHFGASLSSWFADVSRFQSCASDDKPFPWRPWP
jgi:Domain of unknown function (DUF4389)